MKKKFYLKIAKGGKNGFKVEARNKPNSSPLKTQTGYPRQYKYYPTVLIAVTVEIPDSLFNIVQSELTLKIQEAEKAIEIKQEVVENE